MEANDIKSVSTEVSTKMKAAIEHLRRELVGVRTGRASIAILEPVHVEAYGSSMPINQVAGLSIPEPTMIVAQPFEPVADGHDREGHPGREPRPQPDQRRQGDPDPDPAAHRRAPQGAVEAGA